MPQNTNTPGHQNNAENPEQYREREFEIVMISTLFLTIQRHALPAVFVLLPALSIAADDPRYLQALELARQAEYPQALHMLENLMEEQPGNERYFLDYITIMGWAENDMQVLTLVAALPQNTLPIYVLETAGKSARNAKHYDLAEQYYRLAVSKDPSRIASIQGLAMTLADAGKSNEAMKIIHEARIRMPQENTLLVTHAYVLNASSDSHFEQLAVYEQILKQNPDNHDALRGRILTTHWLGASAAALALAEQTPQELSADELFIITEQKLKNALWAVYDSALSATEQKTRLNIIVNELEHLLGRLDPGKQEQSQQVYLDLLTGSIFLDNTQQAKSIYTRLLQPLNTDARTHVAVGQFWMSQGNAKIALNHFSAAIESAPDNMNAQLGIFNALIAQNKYAEAKTFIEKVNRNTPVWLNNDVRSPNHKKVQVALAHAMAQAYTHHLREAQTTLSQMASQAPENADILSHYARVLYWRGWPQQALPVFEYAQSIEPENFNLIDEVHDVAFAARDYEKANKLYQTAAAIGPEKIPGSAIERRQHQLRQYWYKIELSNTSNRGNYEDVAALRLDANLYSPYLGNSWRAYVGELYENGDIDNTTAEYHRQRIGMDYTHKAVHSYADINASIGSDLDPGLRLGADYRVNDRFSLAAEANTFSDDVSLRGRRNSIKAWTVKSSLNYRHSELTQGGVNLSRSEFSDSNLRNTAFVYARQRLISQPRYLMHTQANVYTSSNSLTNAVYFNPKLDLAVEGELQNEWLSYRSSDISMHQDLNGSLGMYKQQQFRTQPTASISYIHRWSFSTSFNLDYGVRASLPVYDGAHEKSVYVFAGIAGYF